MRRSIICLANSYKHGGRCVAGVSLDDGLWIRLRGEAPDGSLQPLEYSLDDCSEPRLLDVIEVELRDALPCGAHPEDWRIAPVRWRLIARPATATQFQKITAAADKATTILRGHCDRISVEEIEARPMQSSLVLVFPTELHWWIREEGGKRRCRALFQHNHVPCNFAVTDPHWIDRLKALADGIYPHSVLVGQAAETWLTISLSEAFYGWHYKLAAAVLVQPK